jgi:hypothetical protein
MTRVAARCIAVHDLIQSADPPEDRSVAALLLNLAGPRVGCLIAGNDAARRGGLMLTQIILLEGRSRVR